MLEEYSAHHHKVACGQYHSAFIGIAEAESQPNKKSLNRLYVWGQNDEGQLSDKIPHGKTSFQRVLDKPECIPLMFGQREYEAISVAAGPSFNLVIGQVNLEVEKEQLNQGTRKKQK